MTVAVLAEKPSAARDIARVLGASCSTADAFTGNGWAVTWLTGHIAELVEPGALERRWQTWALEDLPILPRRVPWRVTTEAAARFEAVKRILVDPNVEEVVCATDAGREGELIFRVAVDLMGIRKPVRRLWISSLTDEAIAEGFQNLRPAEVFEGLGRAALARAWTDWWVGMNASRVLSLTHAETLAAGRVQTPTLAAVVERDRIRETYKPISYLRIEVDLAGPSGETWTAVAYRGSDAYAPDAQRFRPTEIDVDALRVRLQADGLVVQAREREAVEVLAPPLFDLDLLQRTAHARLGLTAAETLQAAQQLYEREKLISYPRTDSPYLTEAVLKVLPPVTESIADRRQLPSGGPLPSRFVRSGSVRDHHAIVPTGRSPRGDLEPEARAVLDLVELRWLAIHHSPARHEIRRGFLRAFSGEGPSWLVEGVFEISPGWREIEGGSRRGQKTRFFDALEEGRVVHAVSVRGTQKRTLPPPPLDDAAVLSIMAEGHLGTPSTRAHVIESLVARGYLERRSTDALAQAGGRVHRLLRPATLLRSTPVGQRLVTRAPRPLTGPELSAQIEAHLAALERGRMTLEEFVDRAHHFVERLVGSVVDSGRPTLVDRSEEVGACVRVEPECALPHTRGVRRDGVLELPEVAREGLSQKVRMAVSEAVSTGETVGVLAQSPWLQLRYALLATGQPTGTTLVVATHNRPALIDDEVMQLRQLGLRADRLHHERTDEAAQETIRLYRRSGLDLLFVLLDRLELSECVAPLTEVRPGAVVVDDAHALSPKSSEYVGGAEALADLRARLEPSVPWVLLSASVPTPGFRDAVTRLGAPGVPILWEPSKTTSLAIEGVVCPRKDRLAALRTVSNRLSGQVLIRCLTREACMAAAEVTGGEAFHGGVCGEDRKTRQDRFQRGSLRILVATSAFASRLPVPGLRGLVFDGLDSGLERFAREISGPSILEEEVRVVVLYERRSQEDLSEGSGAPVQALELIADHLSSVPRPAQVVRGLSGLEPDLFEKYLERLLRVGGARRLENGLCAGGPGWRARYEARRRQRLHDLEALEGWLSAPGCREVNLIRALGEAHAVECGSCDSCDPDSTVLRAWRLPRPRELAVLSDLVRVLRDGGPLAQGALFRAVQGSEISSYRVFVDWIAVLAHAGLIQISRESFVDRERVRDFSRVELTAEGYAPHALRAVRIPLPFASRGRTSGPRAART